MGRVASDTPAHPAAALHLLHLRSDYELFFGNVPSRLAHLLVSTTLSLDATLKVMGVGRRLNG